MPSTVTVAEVRALADTSMSDVDLQAVIDREEAALAAAIGPLTGSRTETLYPTTSLPNTTGLALPLRRPTDAVAATEGGTAVDAAQLRLRQGGWLVGRDRRWSGTAVVFTYTPNDLAAVKVALIELIGMTLATTGYAAEGMGAYNYTALTPADRAKARRRLVRGLQRPRWPQSVRILGYSRPPGSLYADEDYGW